MSRELKAKVPEGRPERQPMTRRNRLNVKNRDPNYHYRVFSDYDDRIEAAKAAGYEVDTDNRKLTDARVDVPGGMGAATVSLGGGRKGVVMRIRKDWYQEDQAGKQQEVNNLEATIKGTAEKYERGDLTISKE
tara:strand:- start:35 stop:433 length:399 start_codon:yes stop_codon:yes gene_type:complete